MQSPPKTTESAENKSYKSIAYFTIFNSGKIKFMLSNSFEHNWMRKIIYRRNGISREEGLFSRTQDPEKIRKIEFKSENWKYYEGCQYIICEQRDAKEEPTGCYKIIEKEKLKVIQTYYGKRITTDSVNDCMYYRKRNKGL